MEMSTDKHLKDIPPAIDHPKLKKKKDMNERMTGINREFIENREMFVFVFFLKMHFMFDN